MGTRKTPAERVEEYRTRAAAIEERERRKLLARSPQWMATRKAMAALREAVACLQQNAGAGPDTDAEHVAHENALVDALEILDTVHLGQFN